MNSRPDREELLERDRLARRAALEVFDRPLVLEAGAGTGKTTTLVGRILAWCLGPGWDRAESALPRGAAGGEAGAIAARTLDRVAAITFTEAAAAEMGTRVGRELARLANGEDPDWLVSEVLPRDLAVRRARARALLGALDRLVTSTIHAWCRRLLAAHPFEAGIHPAFTIDASGAAVDRVAAQVTLESLPRLYGGDGLPEAIRLAAAGHGPTEIAEAVACLLRSGVSPEAVAADPLPPAAAGALARELAAALDGLTRSGLASLGTCRRTPLSRDAAEALLRLADRLEQEVPASWEELVAALFGLQEGALARLQKWSSGSLGAEEARLLEGHVPAFVLAAGEVHAQVATLLGADPAVHAAARAVLAPLLERARGILRQEGVLTYDDLLTLARDLLSRDEATCRRVREGLDLLLVDEFQDTDARQCSIVWLLARAGAGMPGPSLFVVGDPKQSIYAWRSADLSAWDAFLDDVRAAGGDVRQLSRNHRSVPAILDEVERCIAPSMRWERGLQPAFEPLVAHRPATDEMEVRGAGLAPVEHRICWDRDVADPSRPAPDTRAARAAEIEAGALAAEIRRAHDDLGVRWGDVAILLRSRTHAEVHATALRELGVPHVVSGDLSFYRRREVQDASALVLAVLDPHDHVALLAYLRSPLGGLPDAALLPAWREGLPDLAAQLGDGVQARLVEVAAALRRAAEFVPPGLPGHGAIAGWPDAVIGALATLADLREAARTEAADAFVDRLRAVTGLESVAAARWLGGHRLANVQRFLRELRAALAERPGDFGAIVEWLRTGVREAEETDEGPPAEGSEDAVQVLTIHGAKGLDFRHVHLVQVHGSPRGRGDSAAASAALHDGQFEVTLFGQSPPGAVRVRREARRKTDAEQVRTLYVALTRAKDRLVTWGNWRPSGPLPFGAKAACHADLLAARQPAPPPLAALFTELVASDRASADLQGVRWSFPILAQAASAARAAVEAPRVPTVRERAGDARVLAADRDAARSRQSAPLTAALGEWESWTEADEGGPEDLAPHRGAYAPPPVRDAARLAGTVVHVLLEALDPSADLEAELQRAVGGIDSAVQRLAVAGEGGAAADLARRALTRLAGGTVVRARLLEALARLVARELPLVARPEPGTGLAVLALAGQADIVFVDRSGGLVVADYKTGRLENGADLTAEASVHAPQLGAYAACVRAALGGSRPVAAEVWFLDADAVVAVPGAG